MSQLGHASVKPHRDLGHKSRSWSRARLSKRGGTNLSHCISACTSTAQALAQIAPWSDLDYVPMPPL